MVDKSPSGKAVKSQGQGTYRWLRFLHQLDNLAWQMVEMVELIRGKVIGKQPQHQGEFTRTFQ